MVGGWKTGPDGRFKGLLTGVYERGELRYAGSDKHGFRDRDVSDLRPRLKALARASTPSPAASPGHAMELGASSQVSNGWNTPRRRRD